MARFPNFPYDTKMVFFVEITVNNQNGCYGEVLNFWVMMMKGMVKI